ncbi:MAG: hypothetical protein AAB486_00850 [Patescibacteria group bacterium]
MSLDYCLQTKDKTSGRLTYSNLQAALSPEFEILQHQEDKGEISSFSLKHGDERDPLEFTLLKNGEYIINVYDYDKEIYQRILRNIARLAQLLHWSIVDVQTQETIESPNPETFVTKERLDILEAQAGTIINLPEILEQAEKWRNKNMPL